MRWLLLVLIAVGLLSPPAAEGATLTATPATLTSVCNSAAGGDTILLAAGVYDNWPGCSKASTVTLKPATGVTPALSVKLGAGAQNLRFDGFTRFGGWQINGAKNIEIINSTFTGPMEILGANAGILLDSDTFDGLGHGTWEGRLSFGQNATGATVRNSHFGNGGCSDGIQLTGGAHGIVIDGNEFGNLKQGSCAPAHVDPIQMYGASDITITGNYFHDTSTGIMSADGNGSPSTVTNNVFVGNGEYPWAYVDGGGTNDVIRHNAFAGGWEMMVSRSNAGRNSTGVRVTDNVLTGGVTIVSPQPTSGVTQDYNLGGAGAHSLTGPPVFVGAAGRCGYALAAGSPGKGKASDGTDIGLNDCGTFPPLPVDTDRDGIPDSQDACPTVVGALPDGCPAPPPADPCAQTKAERDQALADLASATATLQQVRAQREAYRTRLEVALAKIAAGLAALK